jgi:hypothetical protein
MSLERDHLWARSSSHGLPPRSPLLGRTKGMARSSSGEKSRHYPLSAQRQQSDCPVSPVLLRRALQPELLSPRMARKKAWYEGSCNRAPLGPRGLGACHSLNLHHAMQPQEEPKSHSSDGVPLEKHAERMRGHGVVLKTVHRSWPSSGSRESALKR